MKDPSNPVCRTISTLLSRIGDKWTVLVVATLGDGSEYRGSSGLTRDELRRWHAPRFAVLADAGAAEPTFTLRMNTEATELLHEPGAGGGSRVAGVHYRTADGTTGELHADLTVACDGRTSMARAGAALRVTDYPVTFDAWWFRLPRRDGDELAGPRQLGDTRRHEGEVVVGADPPDGDHLGVDLDDVPHAETPPEPTP